MRQEVKLTSSSAERDLYESLAELYSIIITLDALEKSYLKDSIPEAEYTETCHRLLKQYKSHLQDETVSSAFVDLETFMQAWDVSVLVSFEGSESNEEQLECSKARERIRIGLPATVEQAPSKTAIQGSESQAANAMIIVDATERFITLLDAIKIGMVEKDMLHPLLVDVIQAVNKVTSTDFENKGKIVQWLITLNQMKAAEKLNEEQVREFAYDMHQAYYGFKEIL